jgi:hypothetical protein
MASTMMALMELMTNPHMVLYIINAIGFSGDAIRYSSVPINSSFLIRLASVTTDAEKYP